MQTAKCLDCDGKGEVPIQDYRTPVKPAKIKEPRKPMDKKTKSIVAMMSWTTMVAVMVLCIGNYWSGMSQGLAATSVVALIVWAVGSFTSICVWCDW
jgi:hypothetical protein